MNKTEMMKAKNCADCGFVAKSTASIGKRTFYCTRIRGEKRDESGYYDEEEMRVAGTRKACEFYKLKKDENS
jgi:hypothetical protein